MDDGGRPAAEANDDAARHGADADRLDLVSPISRAFHILDIVASAGTAVRFSDVQRASPLPKATLSRLLHQLEHEGMLVHDPATQRYRLGLRLIRLAHIAWETASLVEVARPVVTRLAESFGTTVHLACLEGGQVLYLDKRVPRPTISMFSSPGRVGPAYCTGVGKAMLAFLPDRERAEAVRRQAFTRHTANTLTTPEALEAALGAIRALGYAVDDEEHEPTVICVAAPIIGGNGAVLGAVSATTTTHVGTLEALVGRVGDLQAAAAEIARAADMQMLSR